MINGERWLRALPIDVEVSTHREPILMPITACPSPTVSTVSTVMQPV